MNADETREKLRIALGSLESEGQPLQLALMFPDGGITFRVGDVPVAEALADCLTPVLVDPER